MLKTRNLTEDSDGDLILTGDNVWITAKNLSLHIIKADEGVIVDIYALGKELEPPLGSTYVYFADAEEDNG